MSSFSALQRLTLRGWNPGFESLAEVPPTSGAPSTAERAPAHCLPASGDVTAAPHRPPSRPAVPTAQSCRPSLAAPAAAKMSAGTTAGSSAASGSNRRLQQTQHQVDEVVDIMRVNVDKVLERDQKLSELDDRADALQAGASQFETSAAKLKRKYWWKNCKMWAIGISVLVIFIIIIIVWCVTS
ncbi:vesicle-associated membrane protein 3 [Castor canadensis]